MRSSPEHDPLHRGRRKGTVNRLWHVVTLLGQSYLEEVGRHSIMKRTGLPAGDLRVLDPLLSYPSKILGRERAIVINLDQIKAVITATEVLVPNSKDPMVGPFVQDLIARISNPNEMHHQAMESNTTVGNVRAVVPFEFKALEGCLESACRMLESETLALEKEAYPTLDGLTSKLSSITLERVRQQKSRLGAISGRVQKVRDEVEHLLDHDMDMADMYLSEKHARQPVGEGSGRIDDIDEPQSDDDIREEDARSARECSGGSISGVKPNVNELEMLLEAYFVQIDDTSNKLSQLREYVDGTEDYITIMLDEKQNQILQMGVMVNTANLVMNAGVVVVSIFGMNINIGLYSAPSAIFWQTTFGTIAGCFTLYGLAIGWSKKSGLLQ